MIKSLEQPYSSQDLEILCDLRSLKCTLSVCNTNSRRVMYMVSQDEMKM